MWFYGLLCDTSPWSRLLTEHGIKIRKIFVIILFYAYIIPIPWHFSSFTINFLSHVKNIASFFSMGNSVHLGTLGRSRDVNYSPLVGNKQTSLVSKGEGKIQQTIFGDNLKVLFTLLNQKASQWFSGALEKTFHAEQQLRQRPESSQGWEPQTTQSTVAGTGCGECWEEALRRQGLGWKGSQRNAKVAGARGRCGVTTPRGEARYLRSPKGTVLL